MIRKVVADTALNDVNEGSALLTLLEAAAQNDFENNAAILSLLELLSIDAIGNNDLDARGADFDLTRIVAAKSTGNITISDSNITKRSTGLYQVKLPPIAGQTTIFVNNALGWDPTGVLYIGRGTANFEGPISYTAIVDNTSFFTITLASALQKDHLISDIIVDAQGTADRLVPAGTSVSIPANNQNPEVAFSTLRDAVLPSGEDNVTGVAIVADNAGSQGNAGINTITTFSSIPFVGATVTNTTALTDARDIESDDDFRERIKSYSSTLARGTERAILAGILGISDPVDSSQVASAVITEPPVVGDPSILYIDDGSGFEPSFTGQSVDTLLKSASGVEEFLQLANFPLTRPQSINAIDGPFEITTNMQFRVLVDSIEETVIFNTAQFLNISAATVSEIIIAINDQSTLFKATFTTDSTRILLFPVAHDAELIQVAELRDSDDATLFANTVLKFPTTEFSQIKLYQNNTLLRERETAATVISNPFTTWNILTAGNLILSVDGTPTQNAAFTNSDFDVSIGPTLTVDDWVAAFNAKFAGVTTTATSSGSLQIVSNKEGSTSSIDILGGTYFDNMFANQIVNTTGQNSDFQLNRQSGNLRILTEIAKGDNITAGIDDAKGSTTSVTTLSGSYSVATDGNSRPAEMVIVDDASAVTTRSDVTLVIGNTITITDEGSSVMRVMSSSVSTFPTVQPGDYLYITSRAGTGLAVEWVHPDNTGLYKVIAKGEHLGAGVDSYLEVYNASTVDTGFAHDVFSPEDIEAFKATEYPQLWKGTFTTTPASSPILELVASFNDNIVNSLATVFKTNAVKLTSTTEDGGSIATPIAAGNASTIFTSGLDAQFGNPSHIANRVSNSDASVSFFKRTTPTNTDADGVVGRTVWLDRVTYGGISGALTDTAIPGEDGVDVYSENIQSTGVLTAADVEFDDVVVFTSGNNKGQYRSIRDKIAGDRVGTQHELPRTLLDHVVGDEATLFRPLDVNSEDSIIFILDQDSVNKTIDVPMSRLGRINTDFAPTSFSFSADDADNEAGITFGTLQVWGKNITGTEFENYSIWMRARNWYQSGGAASGGGAFMVRADEYGPHGENFRFSIEYPTGPTQTATITHENTPGYSLSTYFFGSGGGRVTNITAATTFTTVDLGSDNWRYTFSPGIDFNTTLVGDVISMLDDSGISAANNGQFRVNTVNAASRYVEVYNPDGIATVPGIAEITDITTIDDILGSATVTTVDGTGIDNALDALDATFFVLEDAGGTVAVYYNSGTPNPGAGALGVDRVIEVALLTNDLDSVVAAKTVGLLTIDSQFSASNIAAAMTITNSNNGLFAVGVDGGIPTGFAFGGVVGAADISIDGFYFIIPDASGTVAVWYDVGGGTSQPLHGASRNIEVTTVVAGDNAAAVATKTAVFLAGDLAYASATVLGSVITVTDISTGDRTGQSAGTSGFTVVETTAGVDDTTEIVDVATSVNVYPLLNKSVADIVATVTTSDLLNAVAIGDDSLDIEYATREEVYVPAGISDFSVSLGFGHDPDPLNAINNYVSFYDGQYFIKDFANTNPQFTLKSTVTLQGVAPTVYSMDSTPNSESADLGEFFKLVPTTLNNLYHQFTHKALSQLPIVSDVSIAKAIKRIQVKSTLLGSQGAVEIVGGNANGISFSIIGEAELATVGTDTYVETNVAAFPVTMTTGDYVVVENSNTVKRLSRLTNIDKISVIKGIGDDTDYTWNAKNTNLGEFVRFTIADTSATYGRPAGTVWRWTHNDGGSNLNITDLSNAAVHAVPDDEIAAGGVDAAALEIVNVIAGDGTGALGTFQSFTLTVSGSPTAADGDYFTFESADGTTFAVWFDVDNLTAAPTGATYIAATNKIEVDITAADSEDTIINKLTAELTGGGSPESLAFLGSFAAAQSLGAGFSDVVIGDMLMPFGGFAFGSTVTDWNSGNIARAAGDGEIAGLPIIGVDALSNYIDIVNPEGAAMTDVAIGSGTINIHPVPFLKWNLKASSKVVIDNITIAAAGVGNATVTTVTPNRLTEGDIVTLNDTNAEAIDSPVTVIDVLNPYQFTYTSATASTVFALGNLISAARTETRFKLESLGFNDLMKLSHVDGDAPGFIDCGAAVDDKLVIKGDTFTSNNAGVFRILGITNDSIIFENSAATEALNTIVPFNNLGIGATWTGNSNLIIGIAGTFKNLTVGDWVKKPEDSEELFVQVSGFQTAGGIPTTADLAEVIILGNDYGGIASISTGVSFDENSNVGTGVILNDFDDITILEGDSAAIDDSIFVDNIADTAWFSTVNAGTFTVSQIGTDAATYVPFVRVNNASGFTEADRNLGVTTNGFFVIESENDKYRTIRKLEHLAIDSLNADRRTYFLTPATRIYKMSQVNGTTISPIGKMNYPEDVTTGVDGYTYYTGLLRTVQRVVDGYEPDPTTYPGRRAVGGAIEILPPLIKRITVSIEATTNEGVNLSEISSDIRSAIINYVNDRGVGTDVIMSEIIVAVMNITGVAAATFNVPDPGTERISIADNEKAFIEPTDISVA